jgi:hypothetical protein
MDDMEKLSGYLIDTALADVMTARYKREKQLASSFWLVDNSVLQEKGHRRPPLIHDESEKLGETMIQRLGLKEIGKPK